MIRTAFKASDGVELSLCIWECSEPKGIVQILHGMAEHIARYDSFAQMLASIGYIVAGADLRAHGQNFKDSLCHYEGDLFSHNVRDSIELTEFLHAKYNLPVILMGHSYGSFLTQARILKDTQHIEKVILMGSAYMSGLSLTMGSFLASRKVKAGKGAEKGLMFAKMTFFSYDKKVKDGVNGWLSRDKAQVEKYNNDPYCGNFCSNSFYNSFFKGLKDIKKSDFSLIDKKLKLFIVSGAADEVGGRGKLVVKLYEKYKKSGLKPVLKLYPNARHELLNETNRDEVYADILDFIK